MDVLSYNYNVPLNPQSRNDCFREIAKRVDIDDENILCILADMWWNDIEKKKIVVM